MRKLLIGLAVTAGLAVAIYALASLLRGPERIALEEVGPDQLARLTEGANLVICVLDAARADHVGCYGYQRDTTPNIDRIAQQSLVFENHFTEYPTTYESTASLFTSLHHDTNLINKYKGLAESTFTMARGLRQTGYQTALFTTNIWTTPNVGLGFHFHQTVGRMQLRPHLRAAERPTSPEPELRAFQDWLGKHSRDRFFAYLHFMPPHQPYLQPVHMTALFQHTDPPGYRPENHHQGIYEHPVTDMKRAWDPPPLPEWINLYDANLRYADWVVGELERILRRAHVFDKTVFVITSDHGEAFGEHGYTWHVFGAHDEVTHIPLVIRLPGGSQPWRTAALTQTIDLLPTLFDLLDASYPEEQVQGRSLVPLMAGEADHVRDYLFIAGQGRPPMYIVRSLDHMLLLYSNGIWRSLYDLRTDPGQRENVIAEKPEVAEDMLSAFRRFASSQLRQPFNYLDPDAKQVLLTDSIPQLQERGENAGSREFSDEAKKQMRDLGYLR